MALKNKPVIGMKYILPNTKLFGLKTSPIGDIKPTN